MSIRWITMQKPDRQTIIDFDIDADWRTFDVLCERHDVHEGVVLGAALRFFLHLSTFDNDLKQGVDIWINAYKEQHR